MYQFNPPSKKERGCGNKIAYPNLFRAQVHADRLREEVIYDRMEPEAYRCAFCKKFHVGHSERRG